jgi:putative membrane protein
MDSIRRLILNLLINACAVALTAAVIPGISYVGGIRSLFLIALIFGGINLFIKPILSLLSLPIEIATIGLASVLINAAMLLLVTKFTPGFEIIAFPFPGLSYHGIILAPFMLPWWLTAIVGAILIGAIISVLTWLTKSKK